MEAYKELSIIEKLRSARDSNYSSHYKLSAGDVIGGYAVGESLGSGRFATVWRASRNEFAGGGESSGQVAIKVYRCGRTNQEYWRNEVKILNILTEKMSLSKVSPPIIKYYGTFAPVVFDDLLEPNIYPCIVFGLAGESASRLIKHCKREYGAGVPLECARKIIKDILTGLEFIHSAGLIHTDIKPGNILLDRPISSIDGLNFTALIGDFGSSTPSIDLFSMHVGTDEYVAPELLLERKYTSAIDIWAAFATAFELVTGDKLFDIYHDGGMIYGSDVDEEALEGLECDNSSNSAPELIPADTFLPQNSSLQNSKDQNCNGAGCNDGCEDCCKMDCSDGEGSSSGSEDPEKLALIAYRHLLLMEKVLGSPGKTFAKSARKYYNARGKLKNNPTVIHKPISELLRDNYDIAHAECKAFENFLLHGLKYVPSERCTATEALQLSWLE